MAVLVAAASSATKAKQERVRAIERSRAPCVVAKGKAVTGAAMASQCVRTYSG